jgi:hypothetical protein
LKSKFKILNKHSITKALLILCLLSFKTNSFGQTLHPYVKDFKASSTNGQLHISWTTRPGFTCQDIHIELSKDSANFTRVGTYFGLCGDTAEKHYTFTVNEPYHNTVNYIRLELGNFGYSYIISEQVIKVSNDVLIIPHPANLTSKFYFNNEAKSLATIKFYNTSGSLIFETTTQESSFSLQDLKCTNEVLYYHIDLDGVIKKGKVLMNCL